MPHLLSTINPEGFLVSLFLSEDIGKREDYLTLDRESLCILKDKVREVNDTILLAACRTMMHEFPLNIQQKVEFLNPSVSFYLRQSEVDIQSLARWTNNMDFETVELVMIPYNERYMYFLFFISFCYVLKHFFSKLLIYNCSSHWSLIAINIVDKYCYFLNSLPGPHGLAKM